MTTPRAIAKRHRPGRPFEDELEDDIARFLIPYERRITNLEAALREIIDHGLGCGDCSDKIEIARKALEEVKDGSR